MHITACNIKKLDTKFYNIERPRCWVTVSFGETKYTTQVGVGLDPEWEETTEFTINNAEEDKIEAIFYVKCDKNGNEQQLGDKQSYALNKLIKNKQTYKGLVVPGGKADMMFTALDFGNDEARRRTTPSWISSKSVQARRDERRDGGVRSRSGAHPPTRATIGETDRTREQRARRASFN